MEKQTTQSDFSKKPKEVSTPLRVLTTLLAIVFVFFALVGLIGFDFWRIVFNPSLVKQVLTTEIVSSDIVPAVLEIYSEQRAAKRVASGEALSGVSEPDIVLLISYVKVEGWQKIKQLILTDEFVTHLVSVSVDGLYRWIDSIDLWPSFVWEMTPLKERVAGEQGSEAVQVAYLSMPVCTDIEIADFQKRLSEMPPGVEVLYNLCQFPAPWHDDQIGDYLNTLLDINQNIPPLYDFGATLSQNPPAAANPTFIKNQLRLLRSIAQWGWSGGLLLFLLILVLGVRSLRSLGWFVGIPFTITGFLAIITTVLGQNMIIKFFTDSFLAQTSPFARDEVTRSLQHLTAEFFQPLLIQGILFVVIGVVLIGLMMIKKQKTDSVLPAGPN